MGGQEAHTADAIDATGDRYTVVSSDGHAGAPWADYRPYIDPQHRSDFDDWLAIMRSAESLIGGSRVDLRGKAIRDAFAAEAAVREGGVEGAWDAGIRARELDRDGVAGEVVFPDGLNQNAIPFVGMGSLDPAVSGHAYELRLAGARAYNRWLVDLCAANPGRHAGIATIPFDDVPTAVRELHWAREAGLFGGILLPGLPLTTNDPQWMLHHPRYEPIWDACEELGAPVNIHSTGAGADYGDYPASRWVHSTEAYWASRRAVWHLLWSGVLQRHPGLKVVMTEVMGGWVPFELQYWEYLYDARNPELIREQLPLRPSEYWHRQCFVGASPPAGRLEVENRHVIGVDNILWGSDYPHPDGTWPRSRERMGEMFAGVPDAETRQMLGENAMRIYDFDPDLLRAHATRVGPDRSYVQDAPVEWAQPHKLAYVAGVTTVAH
jgi:predicted TIM-barrel fold metal-dependent hydrolase